MAIDWNPEQCRIFNLLAEGKSNKEVVAAGYGKALVSKVKAEMEAGGTPPERKITAAAAAATPPKPKITGEEGEEILTQVTGFQTEDEALLFIFDPRTRKVRQFRHKYPDAVPMYHKCLEEPINFKGSFDEWLYSMVRTLLVAMGWEYSLVPRSQGLIYNDVKRLIEEGALKLNIDGDGNPKLEVINDNGRDKDQSKESAAGRGFRGAEGEGGGQSGRGEGEGGGETGEHRESTTGTPRAETNTRSTKRSKKQLAKSK